MSNNINELKKSLSDLHKEEEALDLKIDELEKKREGKKRKSQLQILIKKGIPPLDKMIEQNIWEESWSWWNGNEECRLLSSYSGQINYKGEIFIISNYSGYGGMGGMDEGSPGGVKVVRVRK